MVSPSVTWSTKTVQLTYRNLLTGDKLPGTWTARWDGTVVNTASDGTTSRFPSIDLDGGTLEMANGVPSFSQALPITDDPDNTPQGGRILVAFTVGPTGKKVTETFDIRPQMEWPDVVDLNSYVGPGILPGSPQMLLLGVPNGIARLNAQGQVIDAAGNLVTGSIDPDSLQEVIDSGTIIFPEELKGDPGTPGAPGAPGKDGASVQITATVANFAALPSGLTTADKGKGYFANDSGLLYIWGGAAYGSGVAIRGPQGTAGTAATLPDTDYVALYLAGIASTTDTTPPTISSFAGTPGSDAVTLSWAGADAVSFVKEWVLKRGATTLYTGSGTTYTDTGLSLATAYTYTLTAKDYANNVTPTPSSITVTTLAVAGQAFLDNFTRANTTGGWGNGWSTFAAQANTGNVSSNTAKVPTTSGSLGYLFKAPVTPSSNNHWAQVDVTVAPGGSARIFAGLIVGGIDNGSGGMTGYSAVWSSSGGTSGTGGWLISRRDAAVTVLATVDAAAPTVPVSLRLEKNGAALTLKAGGSTVLTFTDPSPLPTGRLTGIYWYSTPNTSNEAVDNFSNGIL